VTERSNAVQAELEEIAALLRREDVPAALTRLNALPRPLDTTTETRAGILRATAYLSERRFGALRDFLAELRRSVATEKDLLEIQLLDAHGKALAGQVREAFSMIVRILRQVSPFAEEHARAGYIAGLCLFRRGHYGWARTQLESSVAYYRLSGDRVGLSFMLNNLALLEKSVGRVDLALSLFDQAAQLVPVEQFVRHHCRLLGNRGVCFLRLGKIRDARVCLTEAQTLARVSPDLFIDVAINNNLGHTYRIEGEYDSALSCYTTALEDARNASSARQECLSLEFLGELLCEMGRFSEAADYLERAYHQAQRLAPQGDLMMEVLRRRGELMTAMGRPDEARADLERAIQLCRARGERRELVLAQRARVLLEGGFDTESEEKIKSVLDELRLLADRFEFVRTIYLILTRDQQELEGHEWWREAVTRGIHYADSLNVDYWKKRLRDVVGYSRLISPIRTRSGIRTGAFIETRSRSFSRCLESVWLASRSDSPVLVMGETGVGKEIVARLAHEKSARCEKPMVAINCGALPESLVESELFGHARGTFTSAHRDKEGLLETAHRGTVLLDEIGELPAQTQVKFLRFLDSGEFRRVGETRLRQTDVRVIAATNRDLAALVGAGRFREDLFYRINVFRIDVPPLRRRRQDILPLASFFLKEAAGSGWVPELSRELQDWFRSYDWPGNVRELKNLCEYLIARAWGRRTIHCGDLPAHIDPKKVAAEVQVTASTSRFEQEKRELEREQIIEALKASRGQILHAAKLLGMSRNTVSQRMRELGIERSSFRNPE
jgi:DNA-binding NtrC family response regulator/tetratricopeptide (TPR) repeat protein